MTPTEVVELAASIGLRAVAITDHDSVDGIDEGLRAGRRLGIEVVPGVEIPLEFESFTLDMLGYFLCGTPSDAFRAQLARLRDGRNERNARILRILRELGCPLDPTELAQVAAGEAIGRPHIAEALRRRGYVSSISEAFERFLRRGAPAYVDRRRLGLAPAVRLLRESGGVAVIAHPGIIRTDHAGLRRLVREAARLGVAGMECSYPTYDQETAARCLALAKKFGLVATGGSDYHGSVKPAARLGQGTGGQPIPDEALEQLRARCDEGPA
jgi:predicted metal-dependent phosphoesterase TrpH